MFGTRPTLAAHFLQAYASELRVTERELELGAACYGVQADHHVWALEEVYLHGNARARTFIPHAPFQPFGFFWREVREQLT